MKVFQVQYNFCFKDYTYLYKTSEDARKKYSDNIVFVDAPDYVFEGWGYDGSKKGKDRFIKPIPPEGWSYDEEKGIFYPTHPEEIEVDIPISSLELDKHYRIGVNKV